VQQSNKKLGNDFELELCEKLSEYGFWTHNLAMNKAGQPADIIAVRNKTAHLIDAKVCSSKGFALSRVEENQELAMTLWDERGNGQGWFALKVPTGEIYMIPHICIQGYKRFQSILSFSEIHDVGKPLEKWVARCK
jgi:Holliday junction resolvase